MSQGNTWSPTTGTVTGLNLTNNYNAAFQALQSSNSGVTAPANDISGAPVLGQPWLDTSSAGLGKFKYFDGVSWLQWGVMDETNHIWQPVIGGGSASLASAGTVDLGSVNPAAVTISGTTTITSFGSSAVIGQFKFLKFSGALTLTYNATSLILPTAANIPTAAGDTAIAKCLGSGNWEIIQYSRASGIALTASLSLIPFASVMFNGTLASSVAGNAMTIALKTAVGVDPSAGDPVIITIPIGGNYTTLTITSALSITVPAGATLGTVNGQTNRIWLGIFNNSGTPVLGVYNSVDSAGPNILCWDESSFPNGTAITSGSGNSQTWYTASTTTGQPFRIIGYVESTQATAGTWASAASKISLYGPGIKRPGDIVKTRSATISAGSTSTSATFAPLTSQNITIAPSSAANMISVFANGTIGNGGTGNAAIRLSRGTTANTNMFGSESLIATGAAFTAAGSVAGCDFPNTAGSTTYSVQGLISTGTLTYSSTPTFMLAQEIQV